MQNRLSICLRAAITLGIFVAGSSTVFAHPGDLDKSFAHAGTAEFDLSDFAADYYWPDRLVVDSSNRVVVGSSLAGGGSQINALLPTGSIDTSFGTAGLLTSDKVIVDMKVDAYDRIVVLQQDDYSDTSLSRFFSDGRPDMSFGTTGSVDVADGSMTTVGDAIALDASGDVYVTGSVLDPSSGYQMFAAKITFAGVLDGSFGTGGFAIPALDPTGMLQSSGYGIIVDPAGNVLITGNSETSSSHVLDVVRLAPDGKLDLAFGHGTGFVQTDILSADPGYHGSNGKAIAIDTHGNIVVAGTAISSSSASMIFATRYTGAGDFDGSFASGMPQMLSISGSQGEDARSVLVDGRENILISGSAVDASLDQAAVVFRLGNDGMLDAKFGSAGLTMIKSSDQGPGGNIAFSHDGQILMAISSSRYMTAWVNKILDFDPLVVMPPSGF